jgi:hypothetical protein
MVIFVATSHQAFSLTCTEGSAVLTTHTIFPHQVLSW